MGYVIGARRPLLLVFALLALASGALAYASPAPDGTAFVVPTAAGAGSHLHIDAKGQDGGLTPKEIPTAFGIAFGKGFAFDPAAVAGECSAQQAQNYACPDDSVAANGSWEGVVQGPGFSPGGDPFNAAVTLYKAAPQQAGDPAGIVFSYRESSSGFKGETIGRLMNLPSDPTYGSQIRFDKLPLPSLPPTITITIKELKLDIGAGSSAPAHSPKVTRTGHKRRARCRYDRHHHRYCRVCRHGKCKWRRVRSKRASARASATGSFLTNPSTCTTSWTVQLQLDYKGHQERREAAVPCTPA
jgi:hypothetical protein